MPRLRIRERLPLEQSPNLRTLILPPPSQPEAQSLPGIPSTTSSSRSLLWWGSPSPVSEQGAFSGLFSSQNEVPLSGFTQPRVCGKGATGSDSAGHWLQDQALLSSSQELSPQSPLVFP